MLLLVAVVVVVVVVVSNFGNISSSNKTANINVKQDNVQTNMESVQWNIQLMPNLHSYRNMENQTYWGWNFDLFGSHNFIYTSVLHG